MNKVIGITGGIASGKSFVSNYLVDLGYEVIDCDKISKYLSEINSPIYNAIIKEFGKDFLNDDLSLNRKKLGSLVFNDSISLKKLNDITHPLIIEEIKNKINESNSDLIFIDIPLLFESNLEYLCDRIVCVYVDEKTQIKRLMNRDNIDKEYAIKRINCQMPLSKKIEMSDYVIYSLEDFELTRINIEKMLKYMKGN